MGRLTGGIEAILISVLVALFEEFVSQAFWILEVELNVEFCVEQDLMAPTC